MIAINASKRFARRFQDGEHILYWSEHAAKRCDERKITPDTVAKALRPHVERTPIGQVVKATCNNLRIVAKRNKYGWIIITAHAT